MSCKKYFLFLLFFIASKSFFAQTPEHHSHNLEFVENKNQWETNILYKADLKNGAVFLEKNCFTFVFKDAKAISKILEAKHIPCEKRQALQESDYNIKCHAYKINFLNSNTDVSVSSSNPSNGYLNYYLGNKSEDWASNVKSYGSVLYENLYPKTDLQIYEQNSNMKYDLILHPFANADNIKFQYQGVDNISIDNGNLLIKTSVNEIKELSPEAYQIKKNKKIKIPCNFKLNNDTLSFVFPDGYDKSKELIIDPILIFSTYSGSNPDNWGFTATYDSRGNVYSGGIVFGTGYPVSTGAFQASFSGGESGAYLNGCDVAIIKYDSAGTLRLWATYLGGSRNEMPHSMIVNSNDELVVYGTTGSNNFPVTSGSYDQSFNGGQSISYDFNSINFSYGIDIFVSKFSVNGTQLLASTYVGGTNNDGMNYPSVLSYNYADGARGEIMIDPSDNVYVVSTTNSTNFPVTSGAFQTTAGGGGQDGCIFKLNSNLSSMIWASYLGGYGADAVYGIVLDDNNDIYVTGGTSSSNFPTTAGALHTNYIGNPSDGFISKISQNGNSILKSTYFGSYTYDQSYLIAYDNLGMIYIYGQTEAWGSTFIQNTSWGTPSSGQFISKLDPNLNSLIWSTAFGTGSGIPDISPTAFLVDLCNRIYVSGWGSYSVNGFGGTSGLPITSNAYQSFTDDNDYYFMVIDDNASSLIYGSYFGSPYSDEHVDGGTSRFDRTGVIYQGVCAGCGGDDNFPTTPGAWSNSNNSSNCNNAVIKFDFQLGQVLANADPMPNDTGCAPFTVNFTNNSNGTSYLWNFGDGTPTSTAVTPTHIFTAVGTYNVMLIATDPAKCNISDTSYLTILVEPSAIVNIGNDTTICEDAQITFNAGNPDCTFLWSTGENTQFVTVSDSGTYWVEVAKDNCVSTDSILVSYPYFNPFDSDTAICVGTTLLLDANNTGSTYLWSTGATTQTVTINNSGTYWVDILINNCPLSDTINVSFEPYPVVDLGKDSIYCSSVGIYLDAENPDCSFLWSTGETSQIINISTQGVYTVQVKNYANCIAADTINIGIVQAPDLGIDLNMCEKDYIMLDAGFSNGNYLWSSGETSQTINVGAEGEYWVQLFIDKCYVYDTVLVKKGGSFSVFFPNAFTPNFDGKNEYFTGYGEEIQYFNLKIFNRWGQLIYETNDASKGWNGKYKGEAVSSDIYIWTSEYKTSCTGEDIQHKKGHVLVLH